MIYLSKDEMRDIPELSKKYELFEKVKYKGKFISEYNFLYGVQAAAEK